MDLDFLEQVQGRAIIGYRARRVTNIKFFAALSSARGLSLMIAAAAAESPRIPAAQVADFRICAPSGCGISIRSIAPKISYELGDFLRLGSRLSSIVAFHFSIHSWSALF